MINHVYAAMSGGVDSAVCAHLLLQQGYQCTGATMRLCGVQCAGEDNVRDAKAVADRLGIPFVSFDMTDAFERDVIAPFVRVYENGGTPNPCINCNAHLKFGALLFEAQKAGASHIATGHYARVGFENGRYVLKKAADASKDQSYVLYTLTQEQLAHVLFPLGELTKDEVRAIAREQGFVSANKPESQDICFIPDGDYASFIERFSGKTYPEGEFVDLQGNVLGRHGGIIRYTVGQRRGLGLALPEPYYVCKKDTDANRVVLCTKKELPTTELVANNFNWISIYCPDAPIRATVRTRYHQKEQPATLYVLEDGRVRVVLDDPQTAAAPGQAVVAYDGEYVLGGGEIE
ncbi:MAG: tRNA 2-thiouridine(34) synthase MnmA [Clostridia bacterium]|nr:tRNA 2-thiouridine(34) synthase MnmA [Clostridia bacterium]